MPRGCSSARSNNVDASSKREARACVQATDTAVIGAAHASTFSKPSESEAA